MQGQRDAYYEIATANSGTVKNDSAVDIDGALFTLGHYAKLGETLGDRRPARRRRRCRQARQGRRVPVAARAGAHARRGAADQCLQLPGLGAVGEGGTGAAGRRAGDRQAGHGDSLAHAAHGARRRRGRRAAGGRAVRRLRQLGRAARRAAAFRRRLVHRLGRDGRDDPLARRHRAALGARQHRGRQRQLARCCCRARRRAARPSTCWPRKWRAR